MEDDAILAGLDEAPEAFALFYRRHVAGLLGYFLRRTDDPELAADLCAETFAAALDGAHRSIRRAVQPSRGCTGSRGGCWRTRSGAGRWRTAPAAGSGWRRST